MTSADLRTTPQQDRSSETIEAILDAAERVFAAKGVDNGTTSDIATEAGISVGRIYYWFSSKAAIVERLTERSERLMTDCITEVVLSRSEHDEQSLIEQVLRSTVELARSSPAVALMLQGQSRGSLVGHHSLKAKLVSATADAYALRFEASRAELLLVAETTVSMSWGAMSQLIEADGDDLLRELVYATSAYLICRFPPENTDIGRLVARARPGPPLDRTGRPLPIRPVTYAEVDLTE